MTTRKLGRKPNSGRPRVRLTAAHVPPTYTPPATLDRYSAVPSESWGMDGNDSVGDCTCAEPDHSTKSDQVAAGNPEVVSTTAEIIAAYSAITGYDPSQTQPDGSNPTDNGAEMQQVREFWQKTGFTLGGQVHKILLFAQVDHNSLSTVQWACDQLGALGVGVNLPNAAMQQFDAGQPWDVVADDGGIDGGHAVAMVGYDQTYVYFVTWGQVQKATWAWWHTYVEEVWCVLDEDFVNAHTGQDPLAGTLYDLGQQFAALTGKPNPVPAPSPSPVPPQPGPTPQPPSPTPGPDTDPADLALVASVDGWVHEEHLTHKARAVAAALKAWMAAKGLV